MTNKKIAEVPGWTRNPAFEKMMTKLGVRFELKEVPIGDIDRKKSQRDMQMRDKPIDDVHVRDLHERMVAEDWFPAGVGYVDEDTGMVVLLAGNHRCESSVLAKRTSMLVYIIEVIKDDEAIKRLVKLLEAISAKSLPIHSNAIMENALVLSESMPTEEVEAEQPN